MNTARRRLLPYLLAALTLTASHCHRPSRRASDANAPQRIVSLSPSTTEILFAVGAGQRVVGRSRFCDYPPEATSLPVVGGFVDANLEEIVRLSPDLVVGARGPAGPLLADKLQSLGIATLFPPTQSIAQIESAISEIAVRVGAAEGGASVVASMRARQKAIAAAVADEARVRTLLVFGVAPIVVAGPESFPSEMIELANGQNVMRSGGAYPAVNAETLITLDPEVVINAAVAGATGQAGAIDRDAPGWRELRAVRQGHLMPLTDETALRPGPRTADGIAAIARILHPAVIIP
ncbi:MAG TPA: helical backbone metal receptor [Polyangiaceae bacterium]|nr:helical backbone metal receptor [Polyangiaceae bacterium]